MQNDTNDDDDVVLYGLADSPWRPPTSANARVLLGWPAYTRPTASAKSVIPARRVRNAEEDETARAPIKLRICAGRIFKVDAGDAAKT